MTSMRKLLVFGLNWEQFVPFGALWRSHVPSFVLLQSVFVINAHAGLFEQEGW